MFFSVCSGHSVKSDGRTEGIEAVFQLAARARIQFTDDVASSGERAMDKDQCVLEAD